MRYFPDTNQEECARNEHQWFDGIDPDWIPSWGMAGQVSICDRCGAVRRRGINNRGEVITVQYIYPYGYSMKKDERPSKQELRAAWFKKQPAAKQLRRKTKAKKRTHLKAVG
jgi:hypothetical protein